MRHRLREAGLGVASDNEACQLHGKMFTKYSASLRALHLFMHQVDFVMSFRTLTNIDRSGKN